MNVVDIHGPQFCPHPCYECASDAARGEHHWIADSIAPDERDDRGEDHPVLVYDRENGTDHALGFFACKHCPAWTPYFDVVDENPNVEEGGYDDVCEGDW